MVERDGAIALIMANGFHENGILRFLCGVGEEAGSQSVLGVTDSQGITICVR